MPAIQRSEFALALNQVANERGIDPKVVLDTVEEAIVAAYRKDHPDIEMEEYSATLDPKTGEARIFHEKKDVTPPGFGRIAAQTAKQVILQTIREKEKEAILSDYKVRIGTIVNGMVLRFAGPNIIIDIGKAEGVMPPPEQIANEKYHLNQKLVVFLKEIHEGPRGEEVVVSRSDNGVLEGLLKREVPEVAQGSVEIKLIVREPGNRAKIAVNSTQSGIDPVGSCVGQKGVRVQAIISEFNGLEKIDIIQWQDDPKEFLIQALSPAKNLVVEINEEEKLASIKVPEEELSLAIGKDGQNVRLASKLTGYRIEIEGDSSLESTLELRDDKDTKEIDNASSSAVSDGVQPVSGEKSTKEQASLSKSQSTNSGENSKKDEGLTLDSSENGQASVVKGQGEKEVKTKETKDERIVNSTKGLVKPQEEAKEEQIAKNEADSENLEESESSEENSNK